MNKKKKLLKIPKIEKEYLKWDKKISYLILLLAFAVSFYIRGIIPGDAVFGGEIIKIATDDAIYHMRLVENLIENFPNRIWFEPYTLFPTGQFISFGGPLWTYMIAITSLIIGLGDPSPELIYTVGVYFPAVFGALLVFPVYVIGKEVFNERTGLISACLIAIMPGQILSRSTLGFVDHHIGEVLFSTLFLMFLMLMLKYDSKKYAILGGISFGLYMLQWTWGVFFGGIVGIFIIGFFIVEHMKGNSLKTPATLFLIAFLSALPFVLIFFDPRNNFSAGAYSWIHVLVTLGSAVFYYMLYLISDNLNKAKLPKFYFPVFMLTIFGSLLVISKIYIPEAYRAFLIFFKIFKEKVGAEQTIAEAIKPTTEMIFGHAPFPNNFGNYPGIIDLFSTYLIATLGMFLLVGLLIRKLNHEKLLFLTWCVIIFMMSNGQNRWFYYYSVNVAILTSFVAVHVIDLAKFDLLTKLEHLKDLTKSKNLVPIGVIILVCLILFIPNYNISSKSTVRGVGGEGFYEWHESLTWMKDNTPGVGLDFNKIYPRPQEGQSFTYPEESYGVMSWWDYGHVITCWAERIPNANPFQSGIGGKESNAPGASTFFSAQSEEKATKVLYDIGRDSKISSKYVVSSAYMAYSINDVMAHWNNAAYDYKTEVLMSGNPQIIFGPRWYTNMEAKLHIFDGNGLEHYRLVHESIPNPYSRGGSAEISCKSVYNFMYKGNVEPVNTGYIKIFEYVEGATITGTGVENEKVYLSLDVKTNQDRIFTYTQSAVVNNGVFSFTVPYSTSGPIEGETGFDTVPLGEYIISHQGVSKTVEINEEDVLNGYAIVI